MSKRICRDIEPSKIGHLGGRGIENKHLLDIGVIKRASGLEGMELAESHFEKQARHMR
jgi:hypothetical protein